MAVNSTILGQNYIALPSGTTAERPGSAQFGWFRANTSTGYLEYYDSTQATWIGVGAFNATGGSTGTYTASTTTYSYHIFESSGTFSVKSGSKNCDVLIVGGGGAGGMYGGGGGAGAVMYVASKPLSVGEYSITIGPGGTGNGQGNTGSTRNGNTTTAFGYTATGGGGGGCYQQQPAGNGANGGGCGAYGTSGGSNPGVGVAPSGDAYTTVYAGRTGGTQSETTSPGYPLSGGAGCNQNGFAPTTNSVYQGGTGGAGVSINVTGTAYYFGGGGGGGIYEGATGGTGGLGGGGGGEESGSGAAGWRSGASGSSSIGGAGGANSGGGGGGSNYNGGGGTGANGGSGIVIIRYISATA